MKKFICLIWLFTPFYIKAKPQLFKTGDRPHMQIGGQLGGNLNYFVYNNAAKRDESAGYQGGLLFRVTRSIAFVQFELNFLRSSVNFKNGIFTTTHFRNIPFSELNMKYHTVGIPFLFGVYAVKKPIFKLRFYTGIETEIIARTRVSLTKLNNQSFNLKQKEKREIFRPAQFSYQLGMGMDIAMFIFDVKYSVGMRSFFKENYRTQTNLFQFTVGAIF